tara:strand:+ start:475 stop:837 length:363 start_codon:yes stop_codon:yes gene_type:complete
MSIIISGKHLPERKHVWVALTDIYGIGKVTALKLCDQAKVKSDVKLSELTESEIDVLRSAVGEIDTEGKKRRQVAENIKRLMDIGSYRGVRHRRGLPVRGQNTKNNASTRKKRRGSKKVK